MPKIGKVTANFTGYAESFDLWYSQKEKFHVKGLPAHFLKTMYDDFQPFGFETESDIQNTLFHKVDEYKKITKNTRRVIMYKIVASLLLTSNKESEGCFSGKKSGISSRIAGGNFGMQDAEIGISYKIAEEVTMGSIKYYPLKEDGTLEFAMRLGHGNDGWSIMEYTPERELFFKNVYDRMQTLLYGLSAFFSSNDDEVIKKIDSSGGQFLLNDAVKKLK